MRRRTASANGHCRPIRRRPRPLQRRLLSPLLHPLLRRLRDLPQRPGRRQSPHPQRRSRSGAPAELDFDIDGGILWGELFDLLTTTEQSCLRGELGAELLKSVREQPVTPVEKRYGWEASVFGCLAPEIAADVFLSLMLADIEGLTEENEACLRNLVDNTNVAGLVAASMPDADPAGAGRVLGFSMGLLACMPVGPLPGGGESAVPVPSAESLLWHHHTGGWIVYSPTVADGVVYFGSDDNHVYALDAVTGDLLWRFETEGVIRSSPTVTDGAVHVGSNDNHVYALDASTGELLWKHDTGDWVQYSPAVSGGRAYLAALAGGDRRVHALDAATGETLWVAETPFPFNPELAPAVVGGKVYVPGGFGEFHALDASTGEVAWTLDTGIPVESLPTVIGGTVYLTAVNTAYALDEATGEIVWEYGTERLPARDVPAVVADGVYYFSPDNHIYALRYAGFITTGEPVWSWSASESDGLIDTTDRWPLKAPARHSTLGLSPACSTPLRPPPASHFGVVEEPSILPLSSRRRPVRRVRRRPPAGTGRRVRRTDLELP